MATKILVTGATGQLGQTFQEKSKATPDHLEFVFVSRADLDITNSEAINAFFSTHDFDYCINCAAYTNVELAESEPDEAYKINAEAVKSLAEVCEIHNTILLHVSTDYVFDGSKTSPYNETDQTNPLNAYGASKLKGEQYIAELLSNYFIIRTSWLYSPYGKNFAKTIASKLQNNEPLKIVTSETGTPTSCADLAEFILFLITNKTEDFGLYHFSASGETTWYGFAQQIAKKLNKTDLVSPVDSFPVKAKRPRYSVMDNQKANNLMQKSFDWRNSVDAVIDQLY
jgi:dTDP-4-dehydrorhamnose reductase